MRSQNWGQLFNNGFISFPHYVGSEKSTFLQHPSLCSQRERAKSATLTKYLQKLHIFHCLSKGRQREMAKNTHFPNSLQNIYICRFTRTSFLCACPGISPQRRFARPFGVVAKSYPVRTVIQLSKNKKSRCIETPKGETTTSL